MLVRNFRQVRLFSKMQMRRQCVLEKMHQKIAQQRQQPRCIA